MGREVGQTESNRGKGNLYQDILHEKKSIFNIEQTKRKLFCKF